MPESSTVRIHKYLADAGICSRRAAEAMVAAGLVRINGKIAEIGDKVDPEFDKVVAEGQVVRPARAPVTFAVHKPRGLICSNSDPHHERTVFELAPPGLRLFCAGRLDKESQGLVILTSDGDLAHRLMHPSSLVVKRYRVSLKQPFPKEKIPLLIKGITVEGERLKVEGAALIGPGHPSLSTEIDVRMHHGKKREIRQLFTYLGFDVAKLNRYQIGRFSVRGLPMGAALKLGPKEIRMLFEEDRNPEPKRIARKA
jgi:23S rRNA pseudouridine2605 synthase